MKKLFFFCSILFFGLSVFGQKKVDRDQRISQELKKLITLQISDSLDVVCAVKDLSLFQTTKTSARIIAVHPSSQIIIFRVAAKHLQRFLDNEAIEFADRLRQPKEELTTGAFDLSLNKLSLVHHLYPAINGNTINASVKEQLLDSTDIDWKGRFFNSGVGASSQSSHASIMATILAGGGNSSPYAVGAATGAAITSSSFASLLPDEDAVYRQYSISVQNHSYGTGIENYYGADAKAYDISVYNNPWLVHVFSAGNSGSSSANTGTYAGIEGFANISGSFKMAKNIITVGSVDSFNNVLPLSSKGPAYDGRIKPELVAYGEDGSSGAAALTSGTAAILQQAYKLAHHDSLPSAALIKATLLNSADDLVTKGPDFTSGFGSLNAYNALQTIQAGSYLENTIAPGEIKTFPFNIPSNTKQFKLTLCWTDTAAAANAAKALVNDIDATLKLQTTSQTWLPWVLSSYAHKDSLLLPAVRKKDTLNTVEQITIDDPQPGSYLLEIAGSHIVNAPQDFSVAWQADTVNSFIWTYPTGSDVLRAGNVNTLRWQTNLAAQAAIQYSYDGTNWQTISPVINTTRQFYKWLAPDTLALTQLRLVIPSLSQPIVSDSFVISNEPDLDLGFNCPDSFLLLWNKSSTNQYQLYQLGNRYLEPIVQTTDTFKVFQKNSYPSLYYAVAPIIGNKTGLRSFALNYTTQGVQCYVRSFFALLQNNNKALLAAELGSLYNVVAVNFQKLTATGYQTISAVSPLSSLSFSFIDSSLIQGGNLYRLEIKLANGQIIYSTIELVYYLPGNPVLVFPNPARQNQPVKIAALEAGKYSIQIFDAGGRRIQTILLNDVLQSLPLMQLSPGMYFIKITSDDAKIYHQKLIVY